MQWNTINVELYNKNLTLEQNNKNGVNLPENNVPVICYDSDKPKYFIGTISCSDEGIKVFESVRGSLYSSYPVYIRWVYFDFCEEG